MTADLEDAPQPNSPRYGSVLVVVVGVRCVTVAIVDVVDVVVVLNHFVAAVLAVLVFGCGVLCGGVIGAHAVSSPCGAWARVAEGSCTCTNASSMT